MDMIVLANQDGVVDMTHEAIARRTNRPLELIRETIKFLEGPDPRSRTKTADGARLKRIDDHRDWGWIIINFDVFRNMATDSQYREKGRVRAQRFRDKERESITLRNVSVTDHNGPVTSAYASAYECTPESEEGIQRGDVSPSSKRYSVPPGDLDEVREKLKIKLCFLFDVNFEKGLGCETEHFLVELSSRPGVMDEAEKIEKLYSTINRSKLPRSPRTLLRDWDSIAVRANHPEYETNDFNKQQGPDRNAGTFNTPERRKQLSDYVAKTQAENIRRIESGKSGS